MQHFLISFITPHCDTIGKKICEYFGKRGTDSDIIFYNGVDKNNDVFITVMPKEYPDKLKPLLQCMAIGKYHVLLISPDDKLDPLMGEMIVALGSDPKVIPLVVIAGITKTNEFLIPNLKKKLMKIIKTTSLNDKIDNIIILKDLDSDLSRLKGKFKEYKTQEINKEVAVHILIDAAFSVKGIGTVILGIIKTGHLKAGDMLELTLADGSTKNVIAKSIQMQDMDHKTASEGDRVGLAVKGIKPNEISRDNSLITKGTMKSSPEITIEFQLNKFANKSLNVKDKQLYHISIDHQVHPAVPINISDGKNNDILKPGEKGKVTFKAEKHFWFNESNNHAIVTILEKFTGQLRILGSGHVLI